MCSGQLVSFAFDDIIEAPSSMRAVPVCIGPCGHTRIAQPRLGFPEAVSSALGGKTESYVALRSSTLISITSNRQIVNATFKDQGSLERIVETARRVRPPNKHTHGRSRGDRSECLRRRPVDPFELGRGSEHERRERPRRC